MKNRSPKAQPRSHTIILSKKKFKEFYTFLNIIKLHFYDLCIVNGAFRFLSNDRTSIVETEFGYFENLNFCIENIGRLVKMLSTLDKKTDITMTIVDNDIIFADSHQSVKIEKLESEFAYNSFISDEKMNDLFFNNFDRETPVIRETQPKAAICNINKMARELNADGILIKHREDNQNKGYLFISNQLRDYKPSKVREYVIELNNDFLIPMKKNHYFIITYLPFIFNKADMTFNCYIDRARPIIIGIYNTLVGNLAINIYGRSSLVEDSE